jgi:hypothetical protein
VRQQTPNDQVNQYSFRRCFGDNYTHSLQLTILVLPKHQIYKLYKIILTPGMKVAKTPNVDVIRSLNYPSLIREAKSRQPFKNNEFYLYMSLSGYE